MQTGLLKAEINDNDTKADTGFKRGGFEILLPTRRRQIPVGGCGGIRSSEIFSNFGPRKWDFWHSEAKLVCYDVSYFYLGGSTTPLYPPQ